ncbi:NosD domain-containing protein [Halocatena marina]|uniref:NosD domain-containing protein n=1 Tax=Halocatena marina TaxID=2934937 RepID=UPI00200F9BDB|nr:NosD domain-containing protein [Halocatena marina]
MSHDKRKQQVLVSGLALLIVASVVTSASLLAIKPASAQTPINSCTTITSSGEYILTQNITNSSATTCIDIQASDVVFDGNGHTIDGIDNNSSFGVFARGVSSDVTVTNLTSTDWRDGIIYLSSDNGTVENTITKSNFQGIYGAGDMNNNSINNNKVVNNTADGIILFGGPSSPTTNNTLSNNYVSGNRLSGIYFDRVTPDNTIVNNTVVNNGLTGIELSNRDNKVVNSTVNNNEGEGISSSENSTLINNIANDNDETGIGVSRNSVSINNTANNNTNNGIGAGENSVIINSTANRNNVNGIAFRQTVNNVTLKDNIVNNNLESGIRIGIIFSNFQGTSKNNTITNNIAHSNEENGIILANTTNNLLSNNNLSKNTNTGLYIENATDSNISSNSVTANGEAGILLNNSSTDNHVYNNLLNNTQNVAFGSKFDSQSNTWNVSNQSGPNIIGGPNLGGNYYATPTGDGFSQTCTDANNDGFCDQPNDFGIDNNNTDFLPLTQVNGQQQPDIDVSPTSLDFGKVTIGDSKTKNVTVTNTGTGTLEVSATDIVGTDASAFTIVGGEAPFSLEPGESQNITVEFAPTSKCTKHATLQIESNDPDEPTTTVELCGKGVELCDDSSGLPGTGGDE